MKKYYLFCFLSLLTLNVFGQGSNCASMDPFCAGGSTLTFPSATGTSITQGDAQSYGCLGSQPNPAWFYMQIDTSGNLVFNLTQVNTSGTPIDVDFIAWGPFVGPPPICGPSNLNSTTQVDCSYSASATEQIDIPNAQSGMFYVVLITNFNGSAGSISLTQTNTNQTGSGSTSCAILCPLTIGEDFILCPDTTANINAVFTPQGTYNSNLTVIQWYNGPTPIPGANGTTLTINAPGTYSVSITNPACGSSAITDSVVVTGPGDFPTADPEDITICGVGSSPYTFDLTENNATILNGQDESLYPITYYESEADAIEGFPFIYTPETYSGTDGQVMWITVEDYNTGCKIRRSFTLHANPAPQPPVLSNFYACDQDHNNVETFDLTAQDGPALALADPNEFTVTYYTSQADADANTNAIAVPESYTTSGGMIYVRVTNNADVNCYGTTSFLIVVTPQPEVTAPADVFICSNDTYVLPALSEGNYYTGTGGTGTMLAVGTAITATQTIYVYAVNGTAPNTCTDEDSFVVTVYPQPVAPEYSDVTECGSYTLEAITGAVYRTATGGAGIQLYPGDILTQTRTVYVWAQTGNGSVTCTDETSFVVTIVHPPVLTTPTALEACDDVTNNGTELFNLIPAGNQAVNNQSGYTITYYTSNATAQAGGTTGQITNPSAYEGSGNVYIRVVAAGDATACYAIKAVQLIVHPKPDVLPVSDYILCDDTAPALDGIETFDLTTKNAEATTDATDTVTYYTSNTDAQLGQNAIQNPSAFQNTVPDQQEIWVRIETVYGCWDTDSFNLIVNPLPQADLTTPVFYACEETPGEGLFDLTEVTPVITSGQPGYSVAYYTDAATTQQIDESTPYLTSDATIYALVTDVVTGCNIVAAVSLDVQPAPIAPTPTPLEECDFNNDNVAAFNLQDALDEIQAAMGNGVTLTIHETEEDANFNNGVGANPIANLNAYTNVQAYTTGGIQTLYITVHSATTECYDVVELQLIVHPVPVATDPLEDFPMCDNGQSDTDGIAIFDLTTYQGTVLNTMDPAQYSVSYHQTQADAALGTPAIQNPAQYQSATGTVYIRVTNNATGCYDIVALVLTVNPLPVANQPAPYTLCDVNNPGDEVEVFDLTSKITEITGGVDGVEVTFYHTNADAIAMTSPITNPANYTNSTNGVEPIFVRVTDNDTGCYRIVLMDIRVEPLPQLTMPTADDLTVCDTNGSGYGNFDLAALTQNMINNGVGLTVAFYHTAQDAALGNNPIQVTNNYQNQVAYNQTIYVVATNTVTGCQSVVYPINLVVAPAPHVVSLPDLTQCDDVDSNNYDNQMVFDLTQQDAVIEAQLGVAAGTYTIHYFAQEASANAGAPRIIVPQSYFGTDGQTIWVRIEVPGTECYQVSSFELNVSQPQELAIPTMYTKCDEDLPNDGLTSFDLTVKNDYILTPYGVGESNVVEYFETEADMDSNNPIATPEDYTNTVNPQTLYVRVTTPQGCKSYSFLTLRVTPLPTPNQTPEALELCDVNAPGDGIEVFDLTLANNNILANDSQSQIAYYTTEAAALAGDTTAAEYISTPTAYSNTTAWTDTVWARISLIGSEPSDPGCVQVVALPLVVNPLPPVFNSAGQVYPYAICSPASTGTATFYIMDHVSNILTEAGLNPLDYTIRFYYDMAAYNAGTALPHVYTNTTPNAQPILVYVENKDTDCFILATMYLYAEQAAVANTANALFECDYDGTNDGYYTAFDLTVQDAAILGSQPASGFSVDYYTSQAAADAADTTSADYIATPAAFVNTSNPQTIWAVVTNLSTTAPCRDVTSFEISVGLLPEPSISSENDDMYVCLSYPDRTPLKTLMLYSNTAATGYTYQWYKDGVAIAGATGQNYAAVEAGIYTVTVWSADSCQSDPITGFEVFESGPASAVSEPGYTVSNPFGQEQSIVVLVEGYGDYQYALSEYGPWQNSNVFTDVPGGPQTIYVRDANTQDEAVECGTLIIENVSVIDYPRFFTPNGDGFNDTWNIQGMTEGYSDTNIFIFDRHGKLLKQISPSGEGWDGTYNGAALPSDDYWFTVEYTYNGHRLEFKAHFAMKR